MEVIIAGDSFRCPAILDKLTQLYPEAALYLHTGEAGKPANPWIIVKGATDTIPYCSALTIEVAGHKIYMAGGKAVSMHILLKRAKTLDCDVVIWGQVHTAWCIELEGVLMINPGSLFHSQNSMPASYARLELHKGKPPECTIIYRTDWDPSLLAWKASATSKKASAACSKDSEPKLMA